MNAKQIKEDILKHVDCTYGDPEDKRKYYAEIVSLLDQYKHEIRKDQDKTTRLACIESVYSVEYTCETPTGNDAYLMEDIINALSNDK